MKPRALVSILIIALAVFIIAVSCATGKKAYVVKEDEELYGTWANPDYNYAAYATPKFVFHPDGKSEGYPITTETHANWYGEFIINNKWIDSEGNIWYTINLKRDHYKNWTYSLVKISNFGKTVEFSDSANDYPKEINSNDPYTKYTIYYRQ